MAYGNRRTYNNRGRAPSDRFWHLKHAGGAEGARQLSVCYYAAHQDQHEEDFTNMAIRSLDDSLSGLPLDGEPHLVTMEYERTYYGKDGPVPRMQSVHLVVPGMDPRDPAFLEAAVSAFHSWYVGCVRNAKATMESTHIDPSSIRLEKIGYSRKDDMSVRFDRSMLREMGYLKPSSVYRMNAASAGLSGSEDLCRSIAAKGAFSDGTDVAVRLRVKRKDGSLDEAGLIAGSASDLMCSLGAYLLDHRGSSVQSLSGSSVLNQAWHAMNCRASKDRAGESLPYITRADFNAMLPQAEARMDRDRAERFRCDIARMGRQGVFADKKQQKLFAVEYADVNGGGRKHLLVAGSTEAGLTRQLNMLSGVSGVGGRYMFDVFHVPGLEAVWKASGSISEGVNVPSKEDGVKGQSFKKIVIDLSLDPAGKAFQGDLQAHSADRALYSGMQVTAGGQRSLAHPFAGIDGDGNLAIAIRLDGEGDLVPITSPRGGSGVGGCRAWVQKDYRRMVEASGLGRAVAHGAANGRLIVAPDGSGLYDIDLGRLAQFDPEGAVLYKDTESYKNGAPGAAPLQPWEAAAAAAAAAKGSEGRFDEAVSAMDGAGLFSGRRERLFAVPEFDLRTGAVDYRFLAASSALKLKAELESAAALCLPRVLGSVAHVPEAEFEWEASGGEWHEYASRDPARPDRFVTFIKPEVDLGDKDMLDAFRRDCAAHGLPGMRSADSAKSIVPDGRAAWKRTISSMPDPGKEAFRQLAPNKGEEDAKGLVSGIAQDQSGSRSIADDD